MSTVRTGRSCPDHVWAFAEEAVGHPDFDLVDWNRLCPGTCGRAGYWFVDKRFQNGEPAYFCIWDGPSRTSGHFRIERAYDADICCDESAVMNTGFGCGWCWPQKTDSVVPPPKQKQFKREGMSLRLRFTVMERDGFTCRYCGANGHGVKLHIDHVIAVVNGGTNDESNLVTSCMECNLGKGARHLSPTQPEAKA